MNQKRICLSDCIDTPEMEKALKMSNYYRAAYNKAEDAWLEALGVLTEHEPIICPDLPDYLAELLAKADNYRDEYRRLFKETNPTPEEYNLLTILSRRNADKDESSS